MRILVVGGAGFVGSNLCEKLLKDGHAVICIDNLITGNEKNISKLRDNPAFSFKNVDASITGDIEFACEWGPVEQIYYLASIASPKKYIEMPFETIDANIWGLKHALELATKWRARILYTSTSEVYGDPEYATQKEDYNGNVDCTSDRAVYDESKRMGETLSFLFKRKFKTDVVVARIFNTFGPNMSPDDGRVIPAFIQAALKSERPKIHGDGEQTRSFCYIDDMVDGLIALMKKGEPGPLNIGNKQAYYTINELWEMVQEVCNIELRPEYIEHPTQGDPVERRPDTTLIEYLIKWKPKTRFVDGLKKTVEYFRNA